MHTNGKGSKSRISSRTRFNANYDEINWKNVTAEATASPTLQKTGISRKTVKRRSNAR